MSALSALRQRVRAWCGRSEEARPPIWQICARRLWEKNVTAMSAALSFRTIFALVPSLVLAFLLLKTAGILEDSKQSMRRVLEASGFAQIVFTDSEADARSASQPTEPQERVVNLADQIETLVDRVEQKLTIGRLGPIGFLLLIYTATTLLTSVEQSLNRIFGAARSRSLVRRLPLYWSVMTLGPICLAAGTYLGRQTTQSVDDATGLIRVLAGLTSWAGPFLGYLLVLWAVYKLLPNAEIPWRCALKGAVVAAPVFLIAKWGFALYVARFVRTGNLYGVLGLVPLFLIWLNLCWLIVLFGAELASLAAESARTGRGRVLGAGRQASDLVAALIAVGGPYQEGLGPVSARRVAAQIRMTHDAAGKALDILTELGLVCPVNSRWGPAYVLARPAATIAVSEILQVPNSAAVPDSYPQDIAAAVACYYDHARASLSTVTLADLLEAGRRTSSAGPIDLRAESHSNR